MTTSARRPSSPVHRQRRLAALGALLALGAIVTLAFSLLRGGGDGPAARGAQRSDGQRAAPAPVELPRGGRRLLPDFRIVAYYGAPQDPQLGALGIGSPTRAVSRLARQARPYQEDTKLMTPRQILKMGPPPDVVVYE